MYDVRNKGIVRYHTYSECDIIHIRCQFIYSASDVINKGHVMSYILRVVFLMAGYGVMYSAHDGIHVSPVMPYIVATMSSKEWV